MSTAQVITSMVAPNAITDRLRRSLCRATPKTITKAFSPGNDAKAPYEKISRDASMTATAARGKRRWNAYGRAMVTAVT